MGLLWLGRADTYALSGTVKDGKGAPIAGAVVYLASDSTVRRLTDAGGAFTIGNPASHEGGRIFRANGRNLAGIGVKGMSLQLLLPASVPGGSIAVFGIQGKKRDERAIGPLAAGAHVVDLPSLPAGVYSLRIVLGPFTGTAHLVHSGTRMTLVQKSSEDREVPAVASPGRPAVVDTLRVRKAGFASAWHPISSYDQAGIAVTLNPEADRVSILPPVSDYAAPGPFVPEIESDVGPGGAYTVVRPRSLGRDGFLHSPVVYGHGIHGEIRPAMDFLKALASHGFVLVACNKLAGGPGSPANHAAMTHGLDWILQQNTMAGSPYQGKLAVTRAAAMGYSVGGAAAVDIGGHEAVKTVISIHGHASKADLRGPLLLTTGTRDTVGQPMQQQTFANSKVPTLLATLTGADHGYIEQAAGGEQRPAIVAWLRYWLHNDAGARRFFFGDNCELGKTPWEAPQRKKWP